MKGLFIPGITEEMFRNGCLESIEALMAEGEIYDIEYSKWIPVSDKVPEDNGFGYYLTTTMFGEVYCDYWTGTNFERQETVIAWMPLPEPYKGRKEEGE